MKFLLDENLSLLHTAAMKKAGCNAVSAVEIGLAGASDEVIRKSAVSAGRILVTLDSDFGNILRYPPIGTPGVIWLRLHPLNNEIIAQALRRVLAELPKEDLTNRLVIVDEAKIRIRGS